MVSHDADFLDSVCTDMVHLEVDARSHGMAWPGAEAGAVQGRLHRAGAVK